MKNLIFAAIVLVSTAAFAEVELLPGNCGSLGCGPAVANLGERLTAVLQDADVQARIGADEVVGFLAVGEFGQSYELLTKTALSPKSECRTPITVADMEMPTTIDGKATVAVAGSNLFIEVAGITHCSF